MVVLLITDDSRSAGAEILWACSRLGVGKGFCIGDLKEWNSSELLSTFCLMERRSIKDSTGKWSHPAKKPGPPWEECVATRSALQSDYGLGPATEVTTWCPHGQAPMGHKQQRPS